MTVDLDKVRAIPIENFMVNLGYSIKRVTSANIFFDSPLRNEKTASFSVFKKRNIWKDFGTGEGGDIIELAQKIWNVNFQDAIKKLDKISSSPIRNEKLKIVKSNKIQLKKILDIVSNRALLDYMKTRNLQPNKVTGLVGEIYYSRNEKNYFGLAFKNDMGGYEIRNKYFKGCYGTKDITTLRKGFNSISVFEGFTDFLSLASEKDIKSDILVLNSCALAEKALPTINKYQKLFLFLDNDKTGDKTTDFLAKSATAKAKDLRYLYKEFKDINEWITQKEKAYE